MSNPSTPESDGPSDAERRLLKSYWQRNIRYMSILLAIWAAAGLGCGIIFADYLNQFELPGSGYPLGFWFAQQGSIIVFVLVILVYALLMNRLDRTYMKARERVRGEADPSRFQGDNI